MKMIKVKSSNIESIGYDERKFQLFVEFKSSDRSKVKIFAYEDVSPSEYEALLNADSVGKHFSSYIKGVKECCKIDCDVIDGTLHARDLILDKGLIMKELADENFKRMKLAVQECGIKDKIIAAQAERIELLRKALLDAVNHIDDGLNTSACMIIGELNADEHLIARFRKLLDDTSNPAA